MSRSCWAPTLFVQENVDFCYIASNVIQIMTKKISTRSSPNICRWGTDRLWIRLRGLASLTQTCTLCNSDSDHWGICMQNKNYLRAQLCRSVAAEEPSKFLYVWMSWLICFRLTRVCWGNPNPRLKIRATMGCDTPGVSCVGSKIPWLHNSQNPFWKPFY